MPTLTLTLEYDTDAERLQYERMVAYVQEMKRLGATAPPGTVLDACERFACEDGRRWLRDNLAATVQARADAEKKCPGTGRRGARGGR